MTVRRCINSVHVIYTHFPGIPASSVSGPKDCRASINEKDHLRQLTDLLVHTGETFQGSVYSRRTYHTFTCMFVFAGCV